MLDTMTFWIIASILIVVGMFLLGLWVGASSQEPLAIGWIFAYPTVAFVILTWTFYTIIHFVIKYW